jgi:MCP family monocarboxylic acid transporter-like MFS transporter 10
MPSYIADKIGSLLTMSIMAFATAITVLVIWLPVNFSENLAGVMIFTVLYGFTSGAFVSLMTPSLVQLCDGKIGDLGIMLGTFMAINSLACLTGLPIQGALVDRENGGFLGLVIFSGVCLLAGSALITASLYMHKHQKKQGLNNVTTVVATPAEV